MEKEKTESFLQLLADGCWHLKRMMGSGILFDEDLLAYPGGESIIIKPQVNISLTSCTIRSMVL